MKVLVENIQQLLIKINNPNTEPEYSLTKTCYGQAADVCVILNILNRACEGTGPYIEKTRSNWRRPQMDL
jgi:hypothetical protein